MVLQCYGFNLRLLTLHCHLLQAKYKDLANCFARCFSHIVMKTVVSSRTNRIVMHKDGRCLDKSNRIAQKLIASWTNRIGMHRRVLFASLICCFKRRCLDKSDRIDIETNCVLHCTAVPLIETALKMFDYTAAQFSREFVSMRIRIRSGLFRQRRLKQQISETTRTNASVHTNTFCPTGYQFFANRSDLSRQRLLRRRHSEANWHVFIYALRYDLS